MPELNRNMKAFITIMAAFIVSMPLSIAFQAIPFKVYTMTVDYRLGRKVVYTLETGGMHRGRPKPARVRWIEFVFPNGKKALVKKRDLEDIEVTDIMNSEIETLGNKGSWALTVRIKNKHKVKNRGTDDEVTFIFKDYKYVERWLNIIEP